MPETKLTEPQRAWITALRSGEYKQTTSVLARVDEAGKPVAFCCLGVACDLAIKAGVEVAVKQDVYDVFPCLRFDDKVAWLPLPVQRWLGLVNDCGEYQGREAPSLVTHNDAGESFEQIADIIESRPAGLFVETSS